jgi:energy-coupling factor transporter ATP-binding protein EcfA2
MPDLSGFSNEYMAGLAAELTLRVLDALGRRLREAIQGTPRERALVRCYQAGSAALLPEDDPAREAYLPILKDFFNQPAVQAELAKLVRGREPDQEILIEAFEDAGYHAEDLPPFDFPARLAAFVEAFLQAVELEPELADTVQVAQLRDATQSLRDLVTDVSAIRRALEQAGSRVASGDVSATGDIQARDIITGIQQNFTLIFQIPFTPPPDLEALRSDYLAYLRNSYQHLDIKGIMQVQRVAPSIPLAAVYVPLKARPQRPDAGESWGRIAGRLWREEDLPAEAIAEMPPAGRSAAPVPVEVALQTEPAVVVLGDPGAGKSTLLKIIALALAEQTDGPLPILLPLNAYARRLLGKGEINLCDFLGEYYASRQKKLAQVGELFEAALRDRQAVILLDGLDEVQTERTFLVRLVQDFVAEFVPDPAETDQAIPGNRVVATSRIVGYDEAPLTGRQWRIYTLTDFDRADIERFVEQWTLAFEVGVHGGDTPVAREAAGREGRDLATPTCWLSGANGSTAFCI